MKLDGKFEVGDLVIRVREMCPSFDKGKAYKISKIGINSTSIGIEGVNGGKIDWDACNFAIVPTPLGQIPLDVADHVSAVPTTFSPLTIMTSQYFHTSVNIIDIDSGMTNQYIELVPYKVRQAKSVNDMRDTLVRELPPEVETSDCAFLIKAIFN